MREEGGLSNPSPPELFVTNQGQVGKRRKGVPQGEKKRFQKCRGGKSVEMSLEGTHLSDVA